MRSSLFAGVMLLALTAGASMADAATCTAPTGVWGPFKPLAHSQSKLAAAGTLKIVALGSSSTYGTGATSPDRSYPAQLASILRKRYPLARIDVVNAGIGGETVALNVARMERDVLTQQPDLVIWQVGTNDVFQKKSATEVHAGLMTGIALVRASGADLVLMESQYFPDKPETEAMRASRAMVHKAAVEAQVGFLPRHALMQHWIEAGDFSPKTMLVADKIHMTDASYRCLAERVADILPVGTEPDAAAVLTVATSADTKAGSNKAIQSH